MSYNGYTGIIEKNPDVTFNEFVWRCARAMGAFVTIREASLDAPIPLRFEVRSYHKDRIQILVNELETVMNESSEDTEKKLRVAQELSRKSEEKRICSSTMERKAIDRLIQQTKDWNPPSPEHVELRSFMLEQLGLCSGGLPLENHVVFTRNEIELLRENKIEAIRRDIAYHEREHQKECDRVQKINEWLARLQESVGLPPNNCPSMEW